MQTLSPKPGPYQNARDPKVAVDSGGNAVFIWRLEDTSDPHGYMDAQTRRRSGSGALSPVQELGSDSSVTGRLAVTPSGTAVFAFVHRYYAGSAGLTVRTRWANGMFGRPQKLASGQSMGALALGLDATGNAVISFKAEGYYYIPETDEYVGYDEPLRRDPFRHWSPWAGGDSLHHRGEILPRRRGQRLRAGCRRLGGLGRNGRHDPGGGRALARAGGHDLRDQDTALGRP